MIIIASEVAKIPCHVIITEKWTFLRVLFTTHTIENKMAEDIIKPMPNSLVVSCTISSPSSISSLREWRPNKHTPEKLRTIPINSNG
jgi:hypothetical protein